MPIAGIQTRNRLLSISDSITSITGGASAALGEIQHGFRGAQREAAFEDRAGGERALLPRSQQIPRPVDGGLHRRLASRGAASADEHAKAIAHPLGNLT